MAAVASMVVTAMTVGKVAKAASMVDPAVAEAAAGKCR